MIAIFNANIPTLFVALLIGLVIGWWLFKRSHKAKDTVIESPAQPPAEGSSLCDESAAAMADVAGEVLAAPVHSELAGTAGPAENLTLLKGVGPKFVALLNENGITRFDQIARLNSNEIMILDGKMGPFKGRLERDRVVEQASYLARGDIHGFEAKFGKLGE